MYCHTKLLAMLAFGFILGPLFLRAKYLLVQLKDEINVDRYNDPVRAIKPIINKTQSRRVECGNDAECDALYGDEKDSCNEQGECEVYTCGHDNMLECLIRYGVGDKGFCDPFTNTCIEMDENWQQCFEQGNCHEFCSTRNCNARGGDGPIVEVPCKSTEGMCDIPFIWEGKTYYTFASVWNGYWCPIAKRSDGTFDNKGDLYNKWGWAVKSFNWENCKTPE